MTSLFGSIKNAVIEFGLLYGLDANETIIDKVKLLDVGVLLNMLDKNDVIVKFHHGNDDRLHMHVKHRLDPTNGFSMKAGLSRRVLYQLDGQNAEVTMKQVTLQKLLEWFELKRKFHPNSFNERESLPLMRNNIEIYADSVGHEEMVEAAFKMQDMSRCIGIEKDFDFESPYAFI